MSEYVKLIDSIVSRSISDDVLVKQVGEVRAKMLDIISYHIRKTDAFAAMYCDGFKSNRVIILDIDEISKYIIDKYSILVYGSTLRQLVMETLDNTQEVDVVPVDSQLYISTGRTYHEVNGSSLVGMICVRLNLDSILGGKTNVRNK